GVLTDVAPRRRLDVLRRQSADDATLAEAAQLGYPLALVSCTGQNEAALFEHGARGWQRRAASAYPSATRAHAWAGPAPGPLPAEAGGQAGQRILSWPPLCR